MLQSSALCVHHLKAVISPLLSSVSNIMRQQTRNTYILRRKYPVPLHKKNQKPRPLKRRSYYYEVVENTELTKRKPLSVILTQDVDKYGFAGDLVSIMPGKAYKYILLPRLGVYASPENMEKYFKQRDPADELLASLRLTLKCLSRFRLTVMMSKTVPWTLEKRHVRINFRLAGNVVPEEAIIMPKNAISGPDLSIEGKEFYVTIKEDNLETKVRCRIHHWDNEDDNIIYTRSNEEEPPAPPIFPEDKEILDSMPKPRFG